MRRLFLGGAAAITLAAACSGSDESGGGGGAAGGDGTSDTTVAGGSGTANDASTASGGPSGSGNGSGGGGGTGGADARPAFVENHVRAVGDVILAQGQERTLYSPLHMNDTGKCVVFKAYNDWLDGNANPNVFFVDLGTGTTELLSAGTEAPNGRETGFGIWRDL